MKRVGWRINLSAAPEFGNTKEKIPLNTNRYISVSMASTGVQINIRLPARSQSATKQYVENYGYRNIREFILEAIWYKIFRDNKYDETLLY